MVNNIDCQWAYRKLKTGMTTKKPWFEEIAMPVLLRHARTTYGWRCADRWLRRDMTTSREATGFMSLAGWPWEREAFRWANLSRNWGYQNKRLAACGYPGAAR